MLEVKELRKTYNSGFFGKVHTHAVDGISFQINDGEIFGLFGESGCGKTTTSKIIMGLINATSGSVLYDGQELVGRKYKKWKPT